MADQGQKRIPEVKQFLKHKPESLLTSIEEVKDGFITQKGRIKSQVPSKWTKNTEVAKRTAAILRPAFYISS
jgi:hypothetical protein